MISMARSLGLPMLVASIAYGAADGTISGTVKDPAGAPFKGAFVRAQNAKTKITVVALSDKQGRYRVQNLPPGDYAIRATAAGYKDDLRSSVKIDAGVLPRRSGADVVCFAGE